jgi:hypothetical protein
MKTKEPSPMWLVLVILLFVLLILHGPWEERWGEVHVDKVELVCDRDPEFLNSVQLELCIDIKRGLNTHE